MTTPEELAKEAASCTRCGLYERATATVFGEGRQNSPLALVGEQPGDQEDKQGHPFVGPKVTVALGAVAGEALFGRGFKVRDHRGRLEEVMVGKWQGPVLSTVHPSSILRARDDEARQEALAGFEADLVKAREALATGSRQPQPT